MCLSILGINKIPTHCLKEALVMLPLSASVLFLKRRPPGFMRSKLIDDLPRFMWVAVRFAKLFFK